MVRKEVGDSSEERTDGTDSNYFLVLSDARDREIRCKEAQPVRGRW
jgi:hypothetical protein